jgi:hypothetical protein
MEKELFMNFYSKIMVQVLGCGILSFQVLGKAPNLSATWDTVTTKSNAMKSAVADPVVNRVKQIKNTKAFVTDTFTFVEIMKAEMNNLALLLASLSMTLGNVAKASNTETQKVVLTNAFSKAGELMNLVFSVLYELNDVLNEAVRAKIIDNNVAEKFAKSLYATLSFSTVSMGYLKDKLIPDLLQFLGSIENIKKTAIKK